MNCAESTVLLEPVIRYDMRCCFNVCSNADINQLNLLHGTKNLKVEKKKNQKVKMDMLRISVNSPGNPGSQSWRKKGRLW